MTKYLNPITICFVGAISKAQLTEACDIARITSGLASKISVRIVEMLRLPNLGHKKGTRKFLAI